MLLAFASVFILSACGRAPKTYGDCILAYVKPGMSAEAVSLAREACREKFPLKAAQMEPTTHDRAILAAAFKFAKRSHDVGKREASAAYRQAFGQMMGGKGEEAKAHRENLQAEALLDSSMTEMLARLMVLWMQEHPGATLEDARAYLSISVMPALADAGIQRWNKPSSQK